MASQVCFWLGSHFELPIQQAVTVKYVRWQQPRKLFFRERIVSTKWYGTTIPYPSPVPPYLSIIMAGDSYGGGIALVQNGERPRFFSRRSRRNSISGSSGHGSEDEEMRMDALSGLQMPPTTFDEVRSIASSSENPRAAFQRSRSLEYMSSTEPLRQTPPCTLSACGKEVESMAQEAFGRQTLPNEKIDPLQAMSRRSLHGSSRTDQSRCPDNRLSQSTHCVGRNQPTPSRINRIRNPYLGTNPDGRRRVRLGGRSQETLKP